MQVAAHSSIATTTAFPLQLTEVPQESIAHQSISFMPAALALGCILGLIGYVYMLLTGETALRANELYLPAGCFVASLFAGAYEVWRRGRALSFVCINSQVGAYRKEKLLSYCLRSEVMYFELRIINTLREVIGFGLLACGCLAAAALNLTTNTGVGLMTLGGGIGLIGVCAAAVYARIICSQYFIPVKGQPIRIGLTRNAAAKLGLAH
jgi:hypothetical protein